MERVGEKSMYTVEKSSQRFCRLSLINNPPQSELPIIRKIDGGIVMSHYFRQMDEEAQKKKKPELINETLPFYLQRFDKIIQNNGGFLANGKLSWVDFYFAGYSETFEGMLGVKLCENYPNVSKLRKKIYSLPKVNEWIATRPVTLV